MVTFEGKIVGNNTYCKSRVLFISKSKQSLQRYNNWEIHGTVLTYCLHAPFTFWVSMPSILTWRYPPGNYHIPPVEQENSSSQPPWKGDMFGPRDIFVKCTAQILFFPVDVPLLGGGYPIASRGFFRQPPPKKNNGFPTSTVPARRRRRLRRLDFNHCWLGAGKSVGLGCRENDMVYIYICIHTHRIHVGNIYQAISP